MVFRTSFYLSRFAAVDPFCPICTLVNCISEKIDLFSGNVNTLKTSLYNTVLLDNDGQLPSAKPICPVAFVNCSFSFCCASFPRIVTCPFGIFFSLYLCTGRVFNQFNLERDGFISIQRDIYQRSYIRENHNLLQFNTINL